MREKLVVVPKIKSPGKRARGVICLIMTIVCFVFALGGVGWINWVATVVFAVVSWKSEIFRNIEYEYTYYEGEFRFARILNQRMRQPMVCVSMDKIVAFAPKGDRSVYRYENDRSVPYKNLTSGDPDATIYEFVFSGGKGLTRYEIEPDDEMLDAVLAKYPRALIRASK